MTHLINISNTTLNILLGLFTLVIGSLAFGDEIGNYDLLRAYKKIGFKIVVLLIFSVLILVCTIVKDSNSEINNKNDLDERDSLNQLKFNKSLGDIAKGTSETMAKYYLKYNAATNDIQKLVKTSSRPAFSDIKPEINIGNIESKISNDTLYITTSFEASQAPLYKLNIQFYYVIRNNTNSFDNRFLDLIKVNPTLFKSPIVPNNQVYQTIINKFFNWQMIENQPTAYLYIFGNYENSKGKKFKFETLKFCRSRTKEFGDVVGKEYAWIYSYIKNNDRP